MKFYCKHFAWNTIVSFSNWEKLLMLKPCENANGLLSLIQISGVCLGEIPIK